NNVVKAFTNKILRVISASTLNNGTPRELNPHLPLLLVVRLLHTSVSTELQSDNHRIPNYTELLLRQVIGRTNDPGAAIRDKQLRLDIHTSHAALPESPTAAGGPEACTTLVEQPL